MTKTEIDLSGVFIGTVVGFDTNTRELDVFIPKLMPAIPEGRRDIQIRTNLGNRNINVRHNSEITMASSIRVKAENVTKPIPNIGSKVKVSFLEGKFKWGFWDIFNPNYDYDIIEEEKYKKVFNLKVGKKEIEISEEDLISISLPENFKVISLKNGKEKTLLISDEGTLTKKIEQLEKIVGSPAIENTELNINGEIEYLDNEPTGIFKMINSMEVDIKNIYSILGQNEPEYKETEITAENIDTEFSSNLEKNYFYQKTQSGKTSRIENENINKIYIGQLLDQNIRVFYLTEVEKDENEEKSLLERIKALEDKIKNL